MSKNIKYLYKNQLIYFRDDITIFDLKNYGIKETLLDEGWNFAVANDYHNIKNIVDIVVNCFNSITKEIIGYYMPPVWFVLTKSKYQCLKI